MNHGKLAFVYAGQGSQKVGMGADFYTAYPSFKEVFDNLPLELRQLCFEGPRELLADTRNTQPSMVAFACGVTAILKEQGITPDITAGLSLGEYSALYASGAMDAETAIDLVTFRGKEMAKAVEGVPCGMSAILGLDRDTLNRCCEESSELGTVKIANYNCPSQLVIGGDKAAVDRASELALEAGAKRAIPLEVSGAFHTPLMEEAEVAMSEYLSDVSFNELNIPVVFNCTAKPLSDNQTISEMLTRQICSGVYFEDSIRYMQSVGVDTIIEIGPGKALSGFIKKIDKNK